MRRWRPRATEKRFWRPQKSILGRTIAILEAMTAILEAKMAPGQIIRGLLGEVGGMAEAYSYARIERVQLEYRKVSYAGHP